jgi:hypothetical protein
MSGSFRIGRIAGIDFIYYGVSRFFSGNGLNGLFIAFTGWFLLSAAQSTRTRSTFDTTFEGVVVSQMITSLCRPFGWPQLVIRV